MIYVRVTAMEVEGQANLYKGDGLGFSFSGWKDIPKKYDKGDHCRQKGSTYSRKSRTKF